MGSACGKLNMAPAGSSPTGDVQVFFDPGVTIVLLSGEVDLALGPELEDAGRDAIDRGEPIRIDASSMSFIDSVGLAFVARLASAGHERGWRLVVDGALPAIRDSLVLVGLTPAIVDLGSPTDDPVVEDTPG